MCGIAGFFGTQPLSEQEVSTCFERMRNRGPDARGIARFRLSNGKNVVLLHSRLKILDLDDRSNQPFQNDSGSLVFNGEIYNYLEVKSDLQRKGASFATSSDTEVLFHCLQKDLSLDDLEGMWAFAYFNRQNETLTLSRDRFGEKPLYYFQDENGIYFGSEVKYLQALTGKSFSPNANQIQRFLVNGYKSLYKKRETFFENVFEVPLATSMVLDANVQSKEHVYWKPRFRPNSSLTRDEIVETVRALLTNALKIRLRADVPIAFCLSGGVDSNILVSLAHRFLGQEVHGFSIVDNDDRYDETASILKSVRELGIRHTMVPVTSDRFLENLRNLVRYHDNPVYTISYYLHWLLQREISNTGYKVSVSGTGADEIFSGYYDHHLFYLNVIQDSPDKLRTSTSNWAAYIKPEVRNPYLQDPQQFIKKPGFRDHIFLKNESYESLLVTPWHEDFDEEKYTSDLLRNRMLNELQHEAVPVILHEDDLNAMYYSVENRSPYLDRALTEFMLTVPSSELINDGYGKSLLRDAMKGVAPEHILLQRKKIGFNTSILKCLDLEDPQLRDQILSESRIFQWIDRNRVEKLFTSKNLQNSDSKFLFYFLSTKLFLEECFQ